MRSNSEVVNPPDLRGSCSYLKGNNFHDVAGAVCGSVLSGRSQVEAEIVHANDLHGYRVTRSLGIVRGITVRSRGIAGQLAAGLRTIVGGKIHEYVVV